MTNPVISTLKEISINEEANFQFWTDKALLCLIMYRERKELNMHPAYIRQAKVAFRQAMKSRREKEFINI